VVLAIVVVLASVLFPVLASVRASAKQASCLSNFRQGVVSVNLYLADYNDQYVPAAYQPNQTNMNSRSDRTWVQLVMPYIREFRVFRCPADDTDRPRRDATFDQDLVPGDTYSQYYTASLRTNLGYNYMALSPIFRDGSSSRWYVRPLEVGKIDNSTLLFIDSRWTQPAQGMEPSGGGSYLVIPPCRYERTPNGGRADTFQAQVGQHFSEIYASGGTHGWRLDRLDDPLVYGGAWPWHNGRINIVRTDGSAKSVTPDGLQVGCDVLPEWDGLIKQPELYMWDLK
jgi:type II secretory pathway pseudopilin PulG